jgi:hypothetical protein
MGITKHQNLFTGLRRFWIISNLFEKLAHYLVILMFLFYCFSAKATNASLCAQLFYTNEQAVPSVHVTSNQFRIEQAALSIGRNLTDDQIIAVLNSYESKATPTEANLLLKEVGFSHLERERLIDSEIAVPASRIKFSREKWDEIDSVLQQLVRDSFIKPQAAEKIIKILKSGNSNMGSQLAHEIGFDVLLHKTNHIFLRSILRTGGVVPGRRVKDKDVKRMASAHSSDFGSTGFGTLMYEKAYFQPLSAKKWKKAKGWGIRLVFDLSLFNDPTTDFNNFYAHNQDGFNLREDPAKFLASLVMAVGNFQSELKSKNGLSLRHLKYIVVPRDEQNYWIEKLTQGGFNPPTGRSWAELIVGSDLLLGGTVAESLRIEK